MKINIKKVSETATIPTKADSESAGFDLYADIPEGSLRIFGGETTLVDTGIAMEIPEGYWGGIYARSGLAFKKGLRPANCVGVIDSSYRGTIKVAIHSDRLKNFGCNDIQHGERIAQFILHKCESIELVEVESLSETERGCGGFGSSGA